MSMSIGLLAACLAAIGPRLQAVELAPPGAPALHAPFDGNLGNAMAGPAKPRLLPGRAGQAVHVDGKPVLFAKPEGFDWSRGTVAMWVRPDTNCKDFTYRMFFDVKRAGKGRIYLIKSGKGGANGLFMCVADAAGKWMAASVFPGRGYSWKAGEWHHLAGSWDSARGVIKLFFDGREVKTARVAPFRIGPMGDAFAIGAAPDGGSAFVGLVDEFRLYQGVATQSPIPSAKNARSAKANAWRLIDGDRDDLAAWNGHGAPNWVEIELPHPTELARVTVYPGALRYARYPSTECSPKRYVIEGWRGGQWRALAPAVDVPRWDQVSKAHRVVTDLKPATITRFRLNITDIYDRGLRVSSPDKPVVPPAERSVVIREIEWQSVQQVAAAERRLRALRAKWQKDIGWWSGKLRDAETPALLVIAKKYGKRLDEVAGALDKQSAREPEAIDAFEQRWGELRQWLDPWRSWLGDAKQSPARAPAPDALLPGALASLTLDVAPGDTPHEFYPASMALDLDVAAAALGRGAPLDLDPYRIKVVEIDAQGRALAFDATKEGDAKFLVPSRFDRITPTRGTLWWTLRNRTHTRFAAVFFPKTDAPPPALGNVTLGNCDRLFFNHVTRSSLPGNIWASTFVDWDGDGKQDVIAGRWTDYVHYWHNVGTATAPKFVGREHWRLIDEDDKHIVANPKHPGLGFSVPIPVDFDGDGRLDIFMQRYYGNVPTFYRNLGPKSFPILARGVQPVGLKHGRLAFGDLDGDGAPDAVVVTPASGKDEVAFQAGKGMSADGRPVFAEPRALNTSPPRTPGVSMRTVAALGDTDGDGDLDLFLYAAPGLWRYENVGTRKRFEFAAGRRVERGGKPINLGEYYPWIAWSDTDGDGDLDLIKGTGLTVFLNEGDAKTLTLGKAVRPAWTRQRAMGRAGLRAHAMADWDGDGDYDYITLDWRGLDLRVYPNQNGLLGKAIPVAVDPNKRDWFGCPDPTEYYALYGNVKLVDWDRDGDLDLFVTSEHSWRFGYIHYYENLGGKFAAEVELRPDARCDYVKFVPGKRGQAAAVDQNSWVDFLSYRTQGNFAPEGGAIRFWFKPNWSASDGETHTLFCTAQHPDTYGIAVADLKLYYIGRKPGLAKRLRPPFAIAKTADGTLRFQAWASAIETTKLAWKPGEWHHVEVDWGKQGMHIRIDGKQAVASAAPPKAMPIGARLHVGSNQTFMIQREREYKSRRAYHPKDWTFIADGAFDDFEIADASGKALLTLPFDGNCDSVQGATGGRTPIGYRCTPGFGDMNGDGLLDMVMMIGDGTRFNTGALYLFPNVGTKHKPRLGKGIPLEHAGGAAFRCHVRTQITPVDWDHDGRIDLILSTENCGQRTNCAVDLFRNVGSPTRPVFGPRQPMRRLNALLEPHHEVKLCAVDLTGNGKEDLVTSTDPGTRVTYRSFLEEAPLAVRIVGVSRRTKD